MSSITEIKNELKQELTSDLMQMMQNLMPSLVEKALSHLPDQLPVSKTPSSSPLPESTEVTPPLQQYRELGYAEYRQFLSREEVLEINQTLDSLDLKPGNTVFDENGTGKIKQIQYLWKYGPVFERLLEKGKQVGAQLLGTEDFTVLNMQLFEKHPGISKPTRSHQDNAYFKMIPATPVTLWIALDDIDEENGCLYYAPKTHLTPTRKHQRYHPHTTFRIRSGVPGLSVCLHEHPEDTDLPMKVQAGDLLAHHSNLIHRAGKNSSKDRRRRAIGIVCIPNECHEEGRLLKYHHDRLREDIELQKVKDPELYRQLKQRFQSLYL